MGIVASIRDFFTQRDPNKKDDPENKNEPPKNPAKAYWKKFLSGLDYELVASDTEFAKNHKSFLDRRKFLLSKITANFQDKLNKDKEVSSDFKLWILKWLEEQNYTYLNNLNFRVLDGSKSFIATWLKQHLDVNIIGNSKNDLLLAVDAKNYLNKLKTDSKDLDKKIFDEDQEAEIMAMLIAYVEHRKKQRHGYTRKTWLIYVLWFFISAAIIASLIAVPGLFQLQTLLWACTSSIIGFGSIYIYKAYDRVKTFGKGVALLMTIATVALLMFNILTFPGGTPVWLFGLGMALAPLSFYANYTLFETDVPTVLRGLFVSWAYWRRTFEDWQTGAQNNKKQTKVTNTTLALRVANLAFNVLLFSASAVGAYYLTAAFVFGLFGLFHLPLTAAPAIAIYAWMIFAPIFLCNIALIFRRGLKIKRQLYEGWSGLKYQENTGEFIEERQFYTRKEAKELKNLRLEGTPKPRLPRFTGWRGIVFGLILGLRARYINKYEEGKENPVEKADHWQTVLFKVFWFGAKFIILLGIAGVVAWFGQSSMVEGIAHKALAFANHINPYFSQWATTYDNVLCNIAIWTRVTAIFYSVQQLLFKWVGDKLLGWIPKKMEKDRPLVNSGKPNGEHSSTNEEANQQQTEKTVSTSTSVTPPKSGWEKFKNDMWRKTFLLTDKDDSDIWEDSFGLERGDGMAAYIRYAYNLYLYQHVSSGLQRAYAKVCAFLSSCIYNPVMYVIGAIFNAGENAAVNAAGAIDRGDPGWEAGMAISNGACSSLGMTLSSMLEKTPYQWVLNTPQNIKIYCEKIKEEGSSRTSSIVSIEGSPPPANEFHFESQSHKKVASSLYSDPKPDNNSTTLLEEDFTDNKNKQNFPANPSHQQQ